MSRGHREESRALLKRALEIALEHDLGDEAGNCYFILSDQCFRRDEYTDALGYLDEALALARKLGNRPYEWAVLAERTYPLFMLGRWDEAQAASEEFTQEQIDAGGVVLSLLQSGVEIHLQRGELDGARRIFSMFSRLEESTDVQERSMLPRARACLHRAEGRPQEALADGEATIEAARTLGIPFQAVKQAIVEAIEAAFALGESAKIEELLDTRSRPFPPAPGRRTSTPTPSASAPASQETEQATRPPPSSSASSGSPSGSRSRCSSTASCSAAKVGQARRTATRRGQRDLRTARGKALARASHSSHPHPTAVGSCLTANHAAENGRGRSNNGLGSSFARPEGFIRATCPPLDASATASTNCGSDWARTASTA